MDSSFSEYLINRAAELERWGSVDDHWLNKWTLAVVIGVGLELAVLAWEFNEEWRVFKRGTIRTPERPNLRLYLFAALAAILVLVGVAGEFSITRSIEEIGTELRIISGKRVEIAEENTGNATKEAGAAIERAGNAIQRSTEVKKENLRLAIDLEAEKRKTGAAVEAGMRALESEKTKRLGLAASLIPRRMDKKDLVRESLKGTEGMDVLFELIHDRESIRAAQLIHSVLMSAGWRIYWRFADDEEQIMDGVVIGVGTHATAPDSVLRVLPPVIETGNKIGLAANVAWILRNGLTANEIEAFVTTDRIDFLPAGAILIRVGLKPDTHVLWDTLSELGRPGLTAATIKDGVIDMSDPIKQGNLRSMFVGSSNAEQIIIKTK